MTNQFRYIHTVYRRCREKTETIKECKLIENHTIIQEVTGKNISYHVIFYSRQRKTATAQQNLELT